MNIKELTETTEIIRNPYPGQYSKCMVQNKVKLIELPDGKTRLEISGAGSFVVKQSIRFIQLIELAGFEESIALISETSRDDIFPFPYWSKAFRIK